MSNRLQNKVALVTAAGQGIGRAITEAFANQGGKVIATDVAEDKVHDLKVAKRIKLDVRAQDNVDAVAKMVGGEFGALDILVNCAGYVHNGSILECGDRDWDFSFDLNVKSMHRTVKAFLPGMLEKKAGSIESVIRSIKSMTDSIQSMSESIESMTWSIEEPRGSDRPRSGAAPRPGRGGDRRAARPGGRAARPRPPRRRSARRVAPGRSRRPNRCRAGCRP